MKMKKKKKGLDFACLFAWMLGYPFGYPFA
jgi:hypothetical protein